MMRNKQATRKGTVLITLGVLLLLSAAALASYNTWMSHKADRSVQDVLQEMQSIRAEQEAVPEIEQNEQTLPVKEEVVIPDYQLNPQMEMPEQPVGDSAYIGTLEIPALGLTLPIASQWSYEALQSTPCRYVGSAYTNDLVIAGHNYRSHFAALHSLVEGDVIYFTDIDGNRFTYAVAYTETLQATAIKEMTSGNWDLTLFTCTMGRQARITVRCTETVTFEY